MTSTLHSATGIPAKSTTTTAPSSAVPTTSTGGTKTALPATGTGASGPPGRNYSNAAATNQAEITANQAAVKTKAGPQTPDNILHNYANYTYKISLLCFKTILDYNRVVEEGSWQAMPALAKKHCYTLFSSGGISSDASASTAERHPDFNVDFYITAMNMMGFAGIDSVSRGSNQLSMDMEVVEPIGTTLLERFESALTEDGPNWTERPLMIQVQFLGYDKEQNPVLIKPATRWIPCRLINIAFDLSESGTSYSIKFLAMSVQKHDALKNSLNLQTLYGHNVGDFCDRIKEAFDEQQKLKLADQFKDKTVKVEPGTFMRGERPGLTEHTRQEKVSVKSQEVADKITFDIDPKIAEATIDIRVAQETMMKSDAAKIEVATQVDDFSTVPTQSGVNSTDKAATFKHNTSTRWKADGRAGGGYHADIIDQGQTYLAFIEKTIRESTFITNQLVDPTSILTTGIDPSKSDILKDPDKGLQWFKVSYVKKLGDFDHMRNLYSSNTVIQIYPYKVLDSIATKSKVLPGEKGMPPPVRNYQYQYSGQNLDIQELQLNFNNAFYQALTGVSTGNTGAKGDKGKSSSKSFQKGKDTQEYNALGVGTMREVINKTASFSGDSNATPVQKQAETLMERLYRMPGSDQMQIDIQIIGDPAYIMQDGVLHQKQKLKTGTADSALALDPASGAILSDSGDVHIYIYYKTPEDVDDNLGIVNFSRGDKRFRNSTISGYFKVLKIDTTFSGGVFSQSLSAVRLFDQFREHSLNPNDPVDADSRKSQDEVTSKGMTVAEEEHGAGAFEATGSPASSAAASNNTTEVDSFATIEQQQEQILNQERAIETGMDDFSTINPDAIQANEFADANVFVKQNQEEFKARIHASEFADAGFNATNITSTDVTTIAGSHDHTDVHGFTINNDGVTKHVSSAVPTNRAQRLAKKRAAWRASQDKTTTSIIPVSSGGDPLLSNKLGTGIAQTTYNPSMETYSNTDKTTVNNNDAQIEQYRNQMIVAGAASGAAMAAWKLGNSLTENNRTIHHSYGNSGYKSWKDMGYRIDLMPVNPVTGN